MGRLCGLKECVRQIRKVHRIVVSVTLLQRSVSVELIVTGWCRSGRGALRLGKWRMNQSPLGRTHSSVSGELLTSTVSELSIRCLTAFEDCQKIVSTPAKFYSATYGSTVVSLRRNSEGSSN